MKSDGGISARRSFRSPSLEKCWTARLTRSQRAPHTEHSPARWVQSIARVDHAKSKSNSARQSSRAQRRLTRVMSCVETRRSCRSVIRLYGQARLLQEGCASSLAHGDDSLPSPERSRYRPSRSRAGDGSPRRVRLARRSPRVHRVEARSSSVFGSGREHPSRTPAQSPRQELRRRRQPLG